MTFELNERQVTHWEVKCDRCGFVARSGQRKLYVERYLKAHGDKPCTNCAEQARIDALPTHHRHADHHSAAYPKPSYWFCCGAVQVGLLSENDCAECGEPFPCPASEEVVNA